ncbi:MAG: hypothetical protein U0930_05860 [Pirellulales bacterium]
MMQRIVCLVTVCFAWFHATNSSIAQHCSPIVETYLSSVTIGHSENEIDLSAVYSKLGGQPKSAYQAYLIAYSSSNSKRIAELTPQQVIKEKMAVVVDTKLIERDKVGSYPAAWKLRKSKFIKLLMEQKVISEYSAETRSLAKEEIYLAVFIPFLDDPEFSVIEGLPEDRHECNYGREAALLFETISTSLSIYRNALETDQKAGNNYTIYLQSIQRRKTPELN